jgi:hypothetical protein
VWRNRIVTIYSEMLRLALADGSGTQRPIPELVAELLSRRLQVAPARTAAGGPPAPVADRLGDLIAYDVALVQLCARLSIEHELAGEQVGPDERRRAEQMLAERLPSLASALTSMPRNTHPIQPGTDPGLG